MSNFSLTSPPISSSPLPLREIPGDYGLPFFGAIKDRLDYFYNQGQDEFFKIRMQKYKSTVFKTNMPPGPFLSKNSKVIVLLDAVSFPILFDNSKVEKLNVLDGTYMPSLSFTGGYRTCAYLDPSETNHRKLKSFFLSVLAGLHDKFIPIFRSSMNEFFINLEDELSEKGEAEFNTLSDKMSFEFVFRLFSNDNTLNKNLSSDGPTDLDLWLLFQLAPLEPLEIKFVPNILMDLILHTFPWPFLFVKSRYNKLCDAFSESASFILDKAEEMDIDRDEAIHNLVFLAGFNAYGGMKTTFPALIKYVGLAGKDLHDKLVEEIRTIVKEEGGVKLSALNKMALVKSVVYEALRIEPPVAFQYGHAKEDILINSHDASFLIKKGEMIFGYQPFATKDPKVFENPDEFIADRFMGEGEKLIKNVFWSNGREIDEPSVDNKQCPGKELVVLLCRLMLVEFFLKYDTFTVEAAKFLLGSSVSFKSVTKATSI